MLVFVCFRNFWSKFGLPFQYACMRFEKSDFRKSKKRVVFIDEFILIT